MQNLPEIRIIQPEIGTQVIPLFQKYRQLEYNLGNPARDNTRCQGENPQ